MDALIFCIRSVTYLKKARSMGSLVIVAINSDASVKNLKVLRGP